MRVRIDVDKCVGAGQCILAAPDVFDQRDDDGMVVLLVEEPPVHLQDDVQRAAKRCPARVILLDD